MEAASIAVQRGHEVILYEKENQLGGNVITAAAPEFKRDIQMLLDYYNTLMKKMNINIKFGTILTAEIVKQEAPDTVIVATGSTLEIPNISGANKPHVKKCTDVLKKEVTVGNKVVVVGGGIEGAEAAAWLATQGKEVTLVEMLGEIAPNLHRANRVMLLDMLEHYSVKTYTNTKVIDIKDKSVYCVNSDLQDIKIEADSVVLATGLTSSRDLYLELLKDPSFETYAIGDCSKPRKIGDAIWEGCLLALNI
jgi:2-enoate reductase